MEVQSRSSVLPLPSSLIKGPFQNNILMERSHRPWWHPQDDKEDEAPAAGGKAVTDAKEQPPECKQQ